MTATAMLAAMAAVTAAAQDPAFESRRLAIGERADTLLPVDVDDDGLQDLIVQSSRDLHVFLYRRDGGFRSPADQVLRLDATTFLWTLGRFCDDPRDHLVTASSRGIHRHRRERAGFAAGSEDLIIHPSLFEGTLSEEHHPILLRFMPDLNADGLSDAVLFGPNELVVLAQRRDESGRPDFALSQKLPIPVDTGLMLHPGPHQPLRMMTSVPSLAHGDLNGDRRADLCYYQNESIGAFYQQPDGRFSAQDPRDIASKKRKRRHQYLKFDVPPQILDLNGDGLLDIVAVYPTKGRAHVLLNREGRTDYTNPDAVLKIADGWGTGVYVEDLDGDGRLEIVLGIVRKFGILGGIDVFLSKRVDLELHFFRYDEKARTYLAEPVQELKFTIPFTFQATRETADIDLTFRPNFKADLDGDGRRDLIVEKDPNTLQVYYGAPQGLVRKVPGGVIPIQPPPGAALTQIFVSDFNGDRRSDLMLRHVIVEGRKHELELKISKSR